MTKYTAFEDEMLLTIKERNTFKNIPAWKKITREMNHYMRNFKRINVKNYTIEMLRNRYQRMTSSKKTPGTNICRRCGKLKRGHTCHPYTKISLKLATCVTLPEADQKTECTMSNIDASNETHITGSFDLDDPFYDPLFQEFYLWLISHNHVDNM